MNQLLQIFKIKKKKIPFWDKSHYDFVGILLVAMSISICTSSLLSRWWVSWLIIFQWRTTILGFQPCPSFGLFPSLSSTQHEITVYQWKFLSLHPYHSLTENVPMASFLFQGSTYTLYTLSCRVLPDPAMPWHLFPSTCSLLVSKANFFFSVASVSCPNPASLPHLRCYSHTTYPAGLLYLQAPCSGWDVSFSIETYYSVYTCDITCHSIL